MSEQRNAEADLAVCEAAMPGPWTLESDIAIDLDGEPIWAAVGPGGRVALLGERARRHPCDDAELILAAMSREALPWWIAEAQVRQAIIDGYSQAIDDQHAEIERLTAENARLKQTISNMEENL